MAEQLPLQFRPIVDEAALLATCFGPLVADAFPLDTGGHVSVLLYCFITVDLFVNKVKIMTKETNPLIFNRLIRKGTADGWWHTPGTCAFHQLFRFCMWLRTKDGTQFQTEARRLCGTKRKALLKAIEVQETRPNTG